MMTSLFRCPVCGGPLLREERALRCAAGHSYDLAKEGYAYLLPPNQKHSAAPGDDKAMAAARRDFLSKEYYIPLLNTICSRILPLAGENPVILDAGCGEGWYDRCIAQAFAQAGRPVQLAGFDIAKPAVRLAAKALPTAQYAVASSFSQPVRTGWADLLLNCFSPFAQEEFLRVLRPGGRMIYVVPGAEHLYQMKAVLYEKPYKNPVQQVEYPGFRAIDEREVQGTITVPAAQLEARLEQYLADLQ